MFLIFLSVIVRVFICGCGKRCCVGTNKAGTYKLWSFLARFPRFHFSCSPTPLSFVLFLPKFCFRGILFSILSQSSIFLLSSGEGTCHAWVLARECRSETRVLVRHSTRKLLAVASGRTGEVAEWVRVLRAHLCVCIPNGPHRG